MISTSHGDKVKTTVQKKMISQVKMNPSVHLMAKVIDAAFTSWNIMHEME